MTQRTNPIMPGDFRVDLLLDEMAKAAERRFGSVWKNGGTLNIPNGDYNSIEEAINAATFLPLENAP